MIHRLILADIVPEEAAYFWSDPDHNDAPWRLLPSLQMWLTLFTPETKVSYSEYDILIDFAKESDLTKFLEKVNLSNPVIVELERN